MSWNAIVAIFGLKVELEPTRPKLTVMGLLGELMAVMGPFIWNDTSSLNVFGLWESARSYGVTPYLSATATGMVSLKSLGDDPSWEIKETYVRLSED